MGFFLKFNAILIEHVSHLSSNPVTLKSINISFLWSLPTYWNSNSQLHLKSLLGLYSSGNKFVIFCFAQLLLQILDNYQNQGQFWNLLVLTISKHPLHVQFNQVLAEIFEVKDKRYHSFIFLKFSLIQRKVTDIGIFWSYNCSVHCWRSRMFYQLLFTKNVQISVVFLSVKFKVMKKIKLYLVS